MPQIQQLKTETFVDSSSSKNKTLLIAGGLFLFNLLLKLCLYPDVSFWLDEVFGVFTAQQPISKIIEACKVDQNPPLYLIILHFWMKLVGMSELGVRSLSILFSALTAPLIFITVRRLWSINVALLAATLFSLADIHFYYATEARAFAFVGFLCVLSYNVFFRVFEKENYWLGLLLGLVNTGAIFSHYIAVFIPISQFIISLFFLRKHKALFFAVVLGGVVSVIALLPWLQYIFGAMPEKGVYWLQPPGIRQLVGLFVSFFGGKLPLLFFGLITLLWGFFNHKKILKLREWESREVFKLVTLVVWILVPISLDYLISFKTPIFLNRYLLYVSVAFYILAGYFIFEMPWDAKVKWGISGVLALLFGLSININVTKDENWKEAINYLKQTRSGQETVVASAWYTNMIFSYYYNPKVFAQYDNNVDLLANENIHFFNTMSREDITAIEPGGKIFLVLCHWEDADPELTVTQTIESSYELTSEKNFEKVRVLEYVRK